VLFASVYGRYQLLHANSENYPFFKGVDLPSFSLTDPWWWVGLFIGGLLPFLFAAWR